jgi:biopolymer transport protein ExbD
MAFATASDRPQMSDINVTPLVDVMLVLLIIFMVTAPLLEHRLGMTLPQSVDRTLPAPPETLVLTVEAGDTFALGSATLAPAQLEQALAEWRQAVPDGVLKIDVDPDASYQSAATAMAAAGRAGIEHRGLVEH